MKNIRKGMSSHQSAKMLNNEWLTPPELLRGLGSFDLDSCSPINRHWDTARKHYHILDDGLSKEWKGRVWCNPPYGLESSKWLAKLADHNNGIALIFARTETKMFFEHVWKRANSLLFIEGRLHFHHVDGTKAKTNAGAPSVLIAYGEEYTKILRETFVRGRFIKL